MSFSKIESQNYFENTVIVDLGSSWEVVKDSELKQLSLSSVHQHVLKEKLHDDALAFYYKGSLSLKEGLVGVRNRLYSWATVKLYYSIFYLLRCSLALKGVFFLRHMRELMYCNLNTSNSLTQLPAMYKTDHRVTMYVVSNILTAYDFIQSNTINGMNAYEWMMQKREEINYKFKTFSEPDAPYFWEDIDDYIKNNSFSELLDLLLSDNEGVFLFQEEYSCLAVPLKRYLLAKNDISNSNIGLEVIKNERLILDYENDVACSKIFI
ncbi:hypothetical protein [Hymenobacter koreensis]|uniref:Uncharacterized protein n=1 Tax=Hymenobacter koreensis TaxID=1084523 RepID=A0ABP8IZR2_9BACT